MEQTIDGQQVATVAVPEPPDDSRIRRYYARAKPFLHTAAKICIGVVSTLAVNVLLLLIAIPVGIAMDQLFWSIAITELGLLVACIIASAVLTLRARRGVGVGLILGWAVGYVGLIGIVVTLIIAAIVIIVAWWLLMVAYISVLGLLAG